MKALILAGGLGSRLKTYPNSVYPKLLLSLGNQTMLDKLVDYWFNDMKVEEMLIVLSEEDYVDMIQKYVNTFHQDKDIKLCLYPKTDGTFKTIYYVLNKHKEYQTFTYLSWSDIVPTQGISAKMDSNVTILTDKNKIHRYLIEDGKITYSPSHKGNIMGLYYYKQLDPFNMLEFYNIVNQDDNEVDFVDYLMHVSESQKILTKEVEIMDIGDVKKYEDYLKNQSVEQRWFNDIEFKDDIVIKKASSEYGKEVMKSESGFYMMIQKSSAEMAFPKIKKFIDDGFIMENLETHGFRTVHKIVKDKTKQISINKIIDAYEIARKALNVKTEKNSFNKAIYNEYYQVPIERYRKIEYLIPKDVDTVNGVHISDFYSIMDRLLTYLQSIKYDWGLIHGDTNSSNTMYNTKLEKIKFIDPRGRFGGLPFVGDVDYDTAKFMYGLSGYDYFNLDKNFKFVKKDNKIFFDIEGYDLDELTDNNHIKILVGLIWLKLPFYIKNNPNKVIASYFYGMQLLTKYLP